ncbi:type VI secretion system Vgr family protein [Pseudomonas viridiflava]|uniref:type VI secretion system Vgr family protein n=7 Tax=Pseudomonas viridiflava TaxID=33069 RepID=UPI0005B6E5E3|nr:type VI secretion system tip protein TssI/VgrG [Pseudomonas viridiflava]KIQ36008.1 type IV secretion protein Rhs [Pseudomonas viridiflava]MDY0918393.1 type VI secretion system tip protein TssI/VgrG [Pseudomonas viridiflava]MEE3915421.1 type VI secretion system tip protein TssI/VgrG [Pseudomonas viridiflava]MEE3974381.1 type VI secretion system tip protein TssI/VgrG [Pseudomonas viridiflava]MEE4019168.1 type VI secretion system tip protein TssI/VgrG [Pseudomonas viridiflava]
MDFSSLFTAQNRRLFKLTMALSGGQQLLLESFVGQEGLSSDFGFQLELISDDAGVKLKSAIGQPATIEIELATGGSRYINGHVFGFGANGSDGGMSNYSAYIGSWLGFLEQRFDSQIYQDQTVEQVLTKVFSRYEGLAKYEFRINRALKPHSYITQYRESDSHFIKRLLEHEGLFFYFEHAADSHKLIIMDDSTVLTPLPEQPQIRFHTASVTESADSITSWTSARELQSSKISVQTFDYRQPNNRIPVTMNSLNQQGDVPSFEMYDYMGQYTHGTPADGEALVRNRIEALELKGKTFVGLSNCRALRPGFTFELTQHYEHDAGSVEDRQFLPMTIEHRGSNNYTTGSQAGYANKFYSVRKKIKFRPQMDSLKPAISGPQTAIIVGPPGEEIYTDEMGRVKVQFHWDRYGQFDDKSSCWVRVAQTGASGGFGSMQIPRVGDEVVVVFLDGNPDRPLIMGSLYNSQNTPPWSLPANKTQSGFLTRSMKGDGGTANFFRFEDKAGAEQVIVHAERNMDTEIELDEKHDVGNNRVVTVGGTQTEVIQKDTVMNVQQGSLTIKVDNQFIQVEALQHIVLKVGDSSITLTKDGITIQGKAINVLGENTFVQGKRVDINK